jgi:hypothetical protein
MMGLWVFFKMFKPPRHPSAEGEKQFFPAEKTYLLTVILLLQLVPPVSYPFKKENS